MSTKQWKKFYAGFRPAQKQFDAKRRPTRAPWIFRLIGIFAPRVPKNWLTRAVKLHEAEVKRRYKKAVHEAKKDPKAFKQKYGRKSAARETVETVTTSGRMTVAGPEQTTVYGRIPLPGGEK